MAEEAPRSFEQESSASGQVISHRKAVGITKKLLEELLKDPLLQDIPNDTTAEELKERLDLEIGRAFVVNLRRSSEDGFEHNPIIVKQKTTIAQLKISIKRTLGRKIKEENGLNCLSWKYFWKSYWLVHNNEKLSDDTKTMKDYGIGDKSEVTFLKRLRRT